VESGGPHRKGGLALLIYAQVIRRDENEKAALRALVDGAGAGEFRPIKAEVA
jgi:hypothetical protein